VFLYLVCNKYNVYGLKGKKPGLVVWQKAHVQEVVGSNPTVCWIDESDASYYIFNEKGNKGSQMGHTKKY
jgi:hypothetical protein